MNTDSSSMKYDVDNHDNAVRHTHVPKSYNGHSVTVVNHRSRLPQRNQLTQTSAADGTSCFQLHIQIPPSQFKLKDNNINDDSNDDYVFIDLTDEFGSQLPGISHFSIVLSPKGRKHGVDYFKKYIDAAFFTAFVKSQRQKLLDLVINHQVY